MHYRVVAVGRVRDPGVRAACDDYLARLRHYTRVEEREAKDEARILEAVPEVSRLVVLSERGEQWTSQELAEWTARWEMDGRDVAFAIGGGGRGGAGPVAPPAGAFGPLPPGGSARAPPPPPSQAP